MQGPNLTSGWRFPRAANLLLPGIVVVALGVAVYAGVFIPFALGPTSLNVGYAPQQPVAYSHALHAGKLGIDCRYCHNTIERAAFAALPPTRTCWNCHGRSTNPDGTQTGPGISWDSDAMRPVKQSFATNTSIEWVKVHDLPDYVYFDHSAHLNAGVGCVSCHGRVDRMEVVTQVQPLSMAWCLDCHRAPAANIRPYARITDLSWKPATASAAEQREMQARRATLQSPRQLTDCSTCHR